MSIQPRSYGRFIETRIQLTFPALMRSLHKSRHEKEDDFLIGTPWLITHTDIPDGWNPPPARVTKAE